mgnify:CR=1 FL=1
MDDNLIHNSLTVEIHSSIPGYTQFRLQSENLTTTHRKQIWFNPLIKLNKQIIDKIPKEDRVKLFFDEELFKKLSHTHSERLEDSIKHGTIDHNVNITLDSLFPDYGLFYVDNQVYTIIDAIWESVRYDKKSSSYHVAVDIELYAGSEMNMEEKEKLKCRKPWNRVRRAYAKFTGKSYIIPEINRPTPKKTTKNKTTKNKRNTSINSTNRTKKNV